MNNDVCCKLNIDIVQEELIINNNLSQGRDAFISYFGRLPYKRLSLESWKTEYILRTHLIR